MTDKEIVKELLSLRKWSQSTLAKELNLTQSNVTGYLNRGVKSMRTDTFEKMINVMGCSLIIRTNTKDYVINNNEQELLKLLIKDSNNTYQSLSDKLNYSSLWVISSHLNTTKGSMRVDNVYQLVNAMNYQLIVKDKMGTNQEWEVTF